MRQLLGFAGLLLAASVSAAGHRIWEIRVQMIAPPSMRMMPRTISTRPGQFDRSRSRRLAVKALECRLQEALPQDALRSDALAR